MRWIVAATVCAGLGLAGCAPRQSDYEVCASYGLSPGQDGQFSQCMGERQQNRIRAAQMLFNRPAPYQPSAYQMQFSPAYQQPMRLQTTCNRIGSMTFCN